MHAPRKMLTIAALTVSTGLLAGCDDAASADRQAMSSIEAARGKRYSGPAGQSEAERYQASQVEYQKAFNAKATNPVTDYAANSAFGASYLDASRNLIQITHNHELQAQQLLIEMRLIGEQVRTGNTIVAGYQATEPKAALAAVSTSAAEVQGDGSAGTWQSSEKTKLPTLWAVKTETSRLASAIAEKQQLVQDLATQRDAQLAAADAAMKESDAAKGDASVAAYTKMADARKAAALLATQSESAKLDIARLEDDLAVQKGLDTNLASGIDALKEQEAAVSKRWEETQKQIAGQKGALVALASGEGKEPASTLASLAGQLEAKLVDLSKARDDALAALTYATQYYGKAETAALSFKNANSSIVNGDGESPRKAGFGLLGDTLDSQRAKAQIGFAELEIASLHSNAVGLLSDVAQTRDALREALKPSGAEMPAALEDKKIDDDLSRFNKSADTAFDAAGNTVGNVANGTGPDVTQRAGKVSQLLLNALWADYFNRLARAGLMAPDKAKEMADAKMADAIATRNNLRELNVVVPPLPGELGAPAPVASTDAPPTDGTTPGGTPAGSTPGAVAAVPEPANAEPAGDVIFETASLVGTWTSSPVATGSTLSLTLAEDGTVQFAASNPTAADPTQKEVVNSSGTFAIQGSKVVITITALANGAAVTPAVAGPFTFNIRVGTTDDTKAQPVLLKAEGSERYGFFTRAGQNAPTAAPAAGTPTTAPTQADPATPATPSTPDAAAVEVPAAPAAGEQTK